MGDVWIKPQPDGTWHMWGDALGEVTNGWASVAELKDKGHTIRWDDRAHMQAFIEQYGEPPPILESD